MQASVAILLFSFVAACSSVFLPENDTMLYGYILPHSHDDVGWKFTIDEYYEMYVKHIYNQVVGALSNHPDRRFISVEMAYFHKWWQETATSQQKDDCRKLIANGQLEFVIGGWTMEDEACTTYSSNIDQMTEGHQFIFDTFGVTPRFGWQIDPFGASNVAHAHFALMGFDATLISRVDHNLKADWQKQKQLQFIWEPSKSYGENLQILTHMMDQWSYSTASPGLRWDRGNEPVNSKNIQKLSEDLVNNIKQRNKWFQSNIVLFPWGTDFDHWAAEYDFDNLDQIVHYINSNSSHYGVTVMYSTLAEYFDALKNKNLTLEKRGNQDFFPYDDKEKKYWTGFYTSRNALKGWVRSRESVQRSAEILHAISTLEGKKSTDDAISLLDKLRQASAEATHHDAVSGTSESWVVRMYCDHLLQGTNAVTNVIDSSLSFLMADDSGHEPLLSLDEGTMQKLDSQHNISVVLWNSLGWNVSRYVSLPIYETNIYVLEANTGHAVPFQVNPALPSIKGPCLSPGTCGVPTLDAPYRLSFLADLPSLGFSTYVISVLSTDHEKILDTSHLAKEYTTIKASTFTLENSFLRVIFDSDSGHLIGVDNIASNISISVKQNYFTYTGNPEMFRVAEGAYVFHPLGPASELMQKPLSYKVFKGSCFDEVQQVFTLPCELTAETSCGISQIFRLYHARGTPEIENFIEVLHGAGPLSFNTDLITRYRTSMQTSYKVFTDENCLEIQTRTLDPLRSDPIAGNYYPITCTAFIRDTESDMQFTVLTDRTHGGGSLSSGELEIMLHRRSISTDGDGPLNLDDTDHLENIQFLLLFDHTSSSTTLRHKLQYMQQFPPTVAFGVVSKETPWNGYRNEFSALKEELPLNVHLLSFQFLNSNYSRLLLRLLHVYEVDDPSPLAKPITINNLNDYFRKKFFSMEERSLTGVKPVKENVKAIDSAIRLNPIQLRTYYVQPDTNSRLSST